MSSLQTKYQPNDSAHRWKASLRQTGAGFRTIQHAAEFFIEWQQTKCDASLIGLLHRIPELITHHGKMAYRGSGPDIQATVNLANFLTTLAYPLGPAVGMEAAPHENKIVLSAVVREAQMVWNRCLMDFCANPIAEFWQWIAPLDLLILNTIERTHPFLYGTVGQTSREFRCIAEFCWSTVDWNWRREWQPNTNAHKPIIGALQEMRQLHRLVNERFEALIPSWVELVTGGTYVWDKKDPLTPCRHFVTGPIPDPDILARLIKICTYPTNTSPNPVPTV